MRKAVINAKGLVTNVVLLGENTTWSPPPGHTVVDAEDAGPGDTWDGSRFIKGVPTPSDSNLMALRAAVSGWDTLTAAQRFAVLKRVIAVIIEKS